MNFDPTRAAQRPSLKSTLIFWTATLITLAVLGYLGHLGFEKYQSLSKQMQALGWNKLLYNNQFQPGCILSVECRSKLWTGLTYGTPAWLPYLPLGLLIMLAVLKPRPEVRRKSPGQAMWADRSSLRSYLLGGVKASPENPRRGYSGVFVDKGVGHILRPPLLDKCGHSWVVAGTGGGKSSRYLKVIHAFAAYEGSSCITLDLKYPDLMSGLLDCALPYYKEGHPVQVFTPYESGGARLELYAYARSLDDANLLAEAFVPEGNDMTEFYRAQARTLLKALFYAAANAERPPTPRELYLLVKEGPGAVQEFLMRESPEAFLEAKTFFMNKLADQISMFANLGRELELFSNEQVSRSFSYQKGEMIDPAQPLETVGMLYIGVTLYQVQSVAGRRLIQILVRLLHATIDTTARKYRGRLPIHVNFNLDEFGNMPPLPYIGERLATMRSFNVCYNVSLQNVTQGEAVYGRLEFKAGTDNNITHRLYIPSSLKDLYTRENLSKEIGRASYQDTTQNDSRGTGLLSFGDARRGETSREVALDLVSPAEMLKWPREAGILFVVSGPQARVALPRMDQKTFEWEGKAIKNPLYFLFERYFKGVNLEHFAEQITGIRHQVRELAQLEAARPPAPPPHPLLSFTTWLETLLESGVTVYLFEGERERIFVRESEVGNCAPEERFFTLEWLRRENGKLLLSESGRKLVSSELRSKMRVHKYLVEIRAYLEAHKSQVAGLGGIDPQSPDAIVQSQALLVTSDGLRQIFGTRMPHLEKIQRSGRRYFILPLDPEALHRVMTQEREV